MMLLGCDNKQQTGGTAAFWAGAGRAFGSVRREQGVQNHTSPMLLSLQSPSESVRVCRAIFVCEFNAKGLLEGKEL